MAESTDFDALPRCVRCGVLLNEPDRDRSTCNECRSPKGKLADLDIAIRASGDSPDRISEWPAIRHLLRGKFGSDHPSEKLWEFFTDLLRAGGIQPNEYLVHPLSTASVRQLISIAEQCVLTEISAVPNPIAPAAHAGTVDKPSSESPVGYLGGADLANALGISATKRDAFFKRLERERRLLDDGCWIETTSRQRNSSQYLYRADDPKILKLADAYKGPKPA